MTNKLYNELVKHNLVPRGQGLIVFGTYLQGSQNYKLDLEDSDVDTRSIIIPSFRDIVYDNRPVSTTMVLDDKSHDVEKDIRLMFNEFKKQSIDSLEILFTDYFIANPFFEEENRELRDMADDIASINKKAMLYCINGKAFKNYKNLKVNTEKKAGNIEKHGYNPKELYHIATAHEMMVRIDNGEKFRDCLIPEKKDYILSLKMGLLKLSEAEALADKYMADISEIKDMYNDFDIDTNYEAIDNLDNLLKKVLMKSLRREL